MKLNELLTGGLTGSGLDQVTEGMLPKHQAPVTKGTITVTARTSTIAVIE